MLENEGIRKKCDEREQAKEGRGRAQNGFVGALTLSFDAERGADLLEGILHRPRPDEVSQDMSGVKGRVGAEQGLRLELSGDITAKQVANGDGR